MKRLLMLVLAVLAVAGVVWSQSVPRAEAQMVVVAGPPGRVGPQLTVPPADLVAASCSSGHVQAAIDASDSDDVVEVPSGTCTWSEVVTISGKGITLRGAGTSSTVISDNLTSDAILHIVAGADLVRVTGFAFDANAIDKTGTNATIEVSGEGSSFRIDHNRIDDIVKRGISVNATAEGGPLYGVIDNNIFECSTVDAMCQSITVIGGAPYTTSASSANASFARPLDLGGTTAVYVEANTFTYIDDQDAVAEGYGGARIVFRFNTVCRASHGHHGTDSGNYRGTLKFEIYGNAFNCAVPSGQRTGHFRSGTGAVFGNTYHSSYGLTVMSNERSNDDCPNCSNWGICDGTNKYDANETDGEGYACRDQIGTVFAGDVDNPGYVLTPLYSWSNTKGGAPQPLSFALAATGRLVDKHILENRNFFNEEAVFDGTSGVGVGIMASRPNTCITGVGYWATDEGEWNSESGPDGQLYRCVSTNTWMLYYTPLTYPHPLRGGS